MRIIYLIVLLFSQLHLSAQDLNKLEEKKLITIYDDNLDFLFSKRNVLIKELKYLTTDINNILLLKQNKQRFINSISDNVSKKSLMVEEVKDLILFKQNFTDRDFVKLYVDANKNDVAKYLDILDTLNRISGLEKCKKCPLARDVEFVVLERNQNGEIDTLKCQSAKYLKINFRGDTLTKTPFDTYSCNALLKNLSLTGAYSKSFVEITYKKKNQKVQIVVKPFILTAGKSERDILIIPLIIDENN